MFTAGFCLPLVICWLFDSVGHGQSNNSGRSRGYYEEFHNFDYQLKLLFSILKFGESSKHLLTMDLLSKPLSSLLIQALTSSFGYEPHPGFRAHIHARIEADRKEWEASKMTKTS
ncbi:hypothetical protein IEQ34_018519 [Dendrobium chrysotoxum]|uniref:Uncharacterized protein n=1 Tax=Dendrobium chrysotoxum TaxID=161865 RepID=A0AAV7G656_DENCH|nr:hypothetical protein IEQ34_018519 [Dendrobium chrysotoxum]